MGWALGEAASMNERGAGGVAVAAIGACVGIWGCCVWGCGCGCAKGWVECSCERPSGEEMVELAKVVSSGRELVPGELCNCGFERICGDVGTPVGTGGGSWYRRRLGRGNVLLRVISWNVFEKFVNCWSVTGRREDDAFGEPGMEVLLEWDGSPRSS